MTQNPTSPYGRRLRTAAAAERARLVARHESAIARYDATAAAMRRLGDVCRDLADRIAALDRIAGNETAPHAAFPDRDREPGIGGRELALEALSRCRADEPVEMRTLLERLEASGVRVGGQKPLVNLTSNFGRLVIVRSCSGYGRGYVAEPDRILGLEARLSQIRDRARDRAMTDDEITEYRRTSRRLSKARVEVDALGTRIAR